MILTIRVAAAPSSHCLTIAELLAMPDEAAKSGMAVTVRGVLTYYEPAHRMAFCKMPQGRSICILQTIPMQ